MEQLFRENRGLIGMWVKRYSSLCATTCDADDLQQAGFLGLVRAAATWDPEQGSWSAWASYYIRSFMLDALGLRKKRLKTLSLDAPLSDDADADTLGDLIADDSLPPVSEAMEQAEVCEAVRGAVEAIRDADARRAIECVYLRTMSHGEAAEALGVSVARLGNLLHKGLAALARDRKLREAMLDEETLFLKYKGVSAFERDLTSTTEAAVIWRDKHRR